MEKLIDMTGSFRVLIVEDSTLFQQLFKEAFLDRFPSIEHYQAIDGEQALQIARWEKEGARTPWINEPKCQSCHTQREFLS